MQFSTLHRLGFNPIPIHFREKKAAISWKQYQTQQATLDECKQWDARQYNVGIATGKVSGCFVLDLDGAEGEATLAELVAQYGDLPTTVSAKTGRGRHLYFRYPEGVEIRNKASHAADGNVLQGLDVRGDGGYVVAPPSLHPDGSSYEWTNSPDDMPMADAPDWLVTLFATPAKKDALLPEPISKPDAYLDSALHGILSDLAQARDGGRNEALNKAAFAVGQLVLQGLNESQAIRRLEAQAQAIGLEQSEIMPTIESGMAGGKAHPRQSYGDWVGQTSKGNALDFGDGDITTLIDNPPPQPDYLVANLWTRKVNAILAASGGVGKSALALVVAVHAAMGRELAPNRGRSDVFGFRFPHPMQVAYFSAEDDEIIISNRLHAIIHAYGLQDHTAQIKANLRIFFTSGKNLYLTKSEGRTCQSTGREQDIITTLSKLDHLGFVVFDPISRFRGGEENDNNDATHFLNAVDAINNTLNVSTLLVHHSPKPTEHKSDDARSRIRGASALADGSRLVMLLSKANKEDAANYGINYDDLPALLRLDFAKVSYNAAPEPMWFRQGDDGVLHPVYLVAKDRQQQDKVAAQILATIRQDAASGTGGWRGAW